MMRDIAAFSFLRRGVMVVHCVCKIYTVCDFCPGFMMAGVSHMYRANTGVFLFFASFLIHVDKACLIVFFLRRLLILHWKPN